MKLTLLGLASYLICLIGCNVKTHTNVTGKFPQLDDSAAVNRFAVNSTICEKVDYVLIHTDSFVLNTGYSRVILAALSKDAGQEIRITIATYGVSFSQREMKAELVTAMKEISEKFNCQFARNRYPN